jgi:hypothetical protein
MKESSGVMMSEVCSLFVPKSSSHNYYVFSDEHDGG